MRLNLRGPWPPKNIRRVTWNDVAPRGPRDNPQYAMYKDVLDAISRLLDEDAR